MDEHAARFKTSKQKIIIPPFYSSVSHEASKNVKQTNHTLFTMVSHQASPFLEDPCSKLNLSNTSISFPSHYTDLDLSRQTTDVSEISMVAHNVNENDAQI